jgi:predicted lipid-binding transport protein (Tim44 family)
MAEFTGYDTGQRTRLSKRVESNQAPPILQDSSRVVPSTETQGLSTIPVNPANQIEEGNKKVKAGQVLGGAAQGALLGASIGSVVPILGTAAGLVAGTIVGGVASVVKQKKTMG